MSENLTGRYRFRASERVFNGTYVLVLQVEYTSQTRSYPGETVAIRDWRDARLEDIDPMNLKVFANG